MMCGGATFGVGEVFKAEVLFPVVLHNFNNPQRVDELVRI
jgi:hypothetical protein